MGFPDYERLHHKLSKNVCAQLDSNGYVVIDDFLGHDWANALLQEMQSLHEQSAYKPNKTQFSLPPTNSTNQPQAFYFIKPHISEVDLHDASVRAKVPQLADLFHSTELLKALTTYLPHYDLKWSTQDRTLKLQHNAGHGGCFPYHYDNPGAPNKRKVTCLLYLNNEWQEKDGGHVQLFPFLQQSVTIAPKMDRVVLFQSDLMLHRVLPSYAERYVLTIWLDGANVNAPKDSQLRLSPSELDDWFTFLERLRRSPVQRLLSRGVYEEEYDNSLRECLQNPATEGWTELLTSHKTHVENLKQNRPLYNLIQRLRDVRVMTPVESLYIG